MADKLDWLNKHLVLVRYVTLADVMEKESYKIQPDLEELFTGMTSAEEMVFKFAGLERYKSASELMVYIAHRRAAVAKLEPEVPEWAKVEVPKPTPEDKAKFDAQLAQMQADYEKARAAADPEMLKLVEDGMEVAYQEFKKVHGIHPMDLLKKLGERLKEDPRPIDPNSPVFVESAKLKAQLSQMQKDLAGTIKSVIPPKVPAHQKKLRDNALDAVYRWVTAPDAENSQKCLDVGNECPDTPAGLLSLSAFWAYGDLLPMGEQTVPTPPGLAANGLCQVLLFCAVHPGGTRKLKERYAEYFRLGMEVMTGADNWEASLASGKAPHREEMSNEQLAMNNEKGTMNNEKRTGEESPTNNPPSYKRWKPGETS